MSSIYVLTKFLNHVDWYGNYVAHSACEIEIIILFFDKRLGVASRQYCPYTISHYVIRVGSFSFIGLIFFKNLGLTIFIVSLL